jgi:hypothetical protein
MARFQRDFDLKVRRSLNGLEERLTAVQKKQLEI